MKVLILILVLAISPLSLMGCSTTSPRPLEPPQTDPISPPEIPEIPRQKPSKEISDCGPLPNRPVFSALAPQNQPRALANYIGRLLQYSTSCAEINDSLIDWIYDAPASTSNNE